MSRTSRSYGDSNHYFWIWKYWQAVLLSSSKALERNSKIHFQIVSHCSKSSSSSLLTHFCDFYLHHFFLICFVCLFCFIYHILYCLGRFTFYQLLQKCHVFSALYPNLNNLFSTYYLNIEENTESFYYISFWVFFFFFLILLDCLSNCEELSVTSALQS